MRADVVEVVDQPLQSSSRPFSTFSYDIAADYEATAGRTAICMAVRVYSKSWGEIVEPDVVKSL